MKRTPIGRTSSLRRSPLRRTPSTLKRTQWLRDRERAKRNKRLARRAGFKNKREMDAVLAEFRRLVLLEADGRCARCLREFPANRLEAHHVVPRGRGKGWPGLHLPSNGRALCRGEYGCHQLVHRHEVIDWPSWITSVPRAEVAA